MKFTGSVIGKIFLILICIILGIVIAFGGLIGGLYFILTQSTMGQIEETVGGYLPDGVDLSFSEEVKEYTVLGWVQALMASMTDMDATTIEQLEGLLGYAFISNMLYETIGIDADTVKESTLGNLGAAITNSLTVEILSEKFDIGLPDMPLFKDEAFLATPVSKAFEDLDSKKISMFIDIKDDESNAVLVAIKDLTLSELGGEKLNDAVNGLTLGEVIDIDDNSNSVLIALKDTTIGELGSEETDEIINSLFVCEIMDIDENSQKILQALRYSSVESVTVELDKASYTEANDAFRISEAYAAAHELELPEYDYIYAADGTPYVYKTVDGEIVESQDGSSFVCYKTKRFGEGAEEKNRPLMGFNDRIGEITFGDVVDISPSSSTLMLSLSSSPIITIDKVIDRMFLGEMIETDDDSATVLKALKYNTLEDKRTDIGKNAADAYTPTAEQLSKQLPEYLYKYATNSKGASVAYVCVLGEDNAPLIRTDAFGTVCYDVYETKEYDGYYRPIIGLNHKLNDLRMDDVFNEEQLSEGILSLLPSNAKINNISSEVSGTVQASSLAVLAGVGVIDTTSDKYNMTNTPKEQRAFIWNNSLNGMLENLIDFVNEPFILDGITGLPRANYEIISPAHTDIAGGAFSSLSDFVEAYLGSGYASNDSLSIVTVILNGDVTVNVDPITDAKFLHDGQYYIPAFNLNGNHTLTFGGGTVILAVTENGGQDLSKHQFYYAFDASNGGDGSNLAYFDGTGASSATAVPGKGFSEVLFR